MGSCARPRPKSRKSAQPAIVPSSSSSSSTLTFDVSGGGGKGLTSGLLEKDHIFLDTKGVCFLCFEECLPEVPETVRRQNLQTSINFCRLTSRYLNFNLGKLVTAPLKKVGRSCRSIYKTVEDRDRPRDRVGVELCEKCVVLANAFCQLHFQVEFHQMVLDRCVRSISEVVQNANKKTKTALFTVSEDEEAMQLQEKTFTRLTLGGFKSAHNLRNKLYEKSLARLSSSFPLIRLRRICKSGEWIALLNRGRRGNINSNNGDKGPKNIPVNSRETVVASLMGCVISFWLVLSLSFINPDDLIKKAKVEDLLGMQQNLIHQQHQIIRCAESAGQIPVEVLDVPKLKSKFQKDSASKPTTSKRAKLNKPETAARPRPGRKRALQEGGAGERDSTEGKKKRGRKPKTAVDTAKLQPNKDGESQKSLQISHVSSKIVPPPKDVQVHDKSTHNKCPVSWTPKSSKYPTTLEPIPSHSPENQTAKVPPTSQPSCSVVAKPNLQPNDQGAFVRPPPQSFSQPQASAPQPYSAKTDVVVPAQAPLAPSSSLTPLYSGHEQQPPPPSYNTSGVYTGSGSQTYPSSGAPYSMPPQSYVHSTQNQYSGASYCYNSYQSSMPPAPAPETSQYNYNYNYAPYNYTPQGQAPACWPAYDSSVTAQPTATSVPPGHVTQAASDMTYQPYNPVPVYSAAGSNDLSYSTYQNYGQHPLPQPQLKDEYSCPSQTYDTYGGNPGDTYYNQQAPQPHTSQTYPQLHGFGTDNSTTSVDVNIIYPGKGQDGETPSPPLIHEEPKLDNPEEESGTTTTSDSSSTLKSTPEFPQSLSIFPEVHWRQQQNQNDRISCTVSGCTEQFVRADHLELHLKAHGSFQCSFCQLNFGKAHSLALHEKSKHGKAGGSSSSNKCKCPRCGFVSVSQQNFFLHFLGEHLNIQLYEEPCPICKKPFIQGTRSYVRKNHFKNYHDTEGKNPTSIFKCNGCGAPFLKESQSDMAISQGNNKWGGKYREIWEMGNNGQYGK